MNKAKIFNLIFNGVGALIGLIVVGYVAYSALHTETEPPCSERYPPPTRFALQTSDGALLSPIELQARVGLRDWGVMENATVVPAAEAPTGAALEVKLARIADGEPHPARRANGVDFRWSPHGVAPAQAACLRYSVWLPRGFAFNGGGILPGIIGASPAAAAGQAEEETRFAARLQWRSDGTGELAVAVPGSGYRPIVQRALPLPTGRWIGVEQEVVLNRPGEANGVVRLWVDGELKAEDAGVALRRDESAKITGVLADIGYLREPGKVSALRLSPFELAWR
jgi:hypothetical protein